MKMRSKKHKNKSKDDREKSRKKHKRKDREEKHTETDSSFNTSEDEQEWVEKSVSPSTTFANENAAAVSGDQDASKREDWMNMKTIFPCVFKERGTDSRDSTSSANKIDINELGQSSRELNPYWKNGGCGLPAVKSNEKERIMDAAWLKKSLRRAVEQAAIENRSLEEIAAERWGSLEEIQSMISAAEGRGFRSSAGYSKSTFETVKRTSHFEKSNPEKHKASQSARSAMTDHSSRTDRRQRYDSPQTSRQKRSYKKPMDDDYCHSTAYKSNQIGKKNWQKSKRDEIAEEKQSDLNPTAGESGYSGNADGTCPVKTTEIEPLTEAEMNKLGAKIVKAEIMGNTALAEELKLQLRKVRDSANDPHRCKTENVQREILTLTLSRTDEKGVCRPLERRSKSGESSENLKRKNTETHVSGNRVKRYFDDDKYCLEQLFQKERGRSTREDDAAFAKVASKNMDMEEMFEERIARAKSDVQQDTMERSRAIQEHKRFSKSIDTCHWCIDSKRMIKHTIVAMDSEICLSLPRYASLTVGHCVLTPTQHVACQLQLDENVWEKLKLFKRALRSMFAERKQYPVFYEVYKSRYKFPHMRLECVPLPMKVGELAPMYFKKALLECETEWSMNKKIIDLEGKYVRQAVPNGLSYFAVEFEGNRGYAHIIEDEHLFPKNFAEEIIGGMLDLDHDVWRKPREQSFEQLREKMLQFSETWKKYESETKN